MYMRTCQMSFGWDFAPRMPLIGPWRPVYVECHRNASLSDLHVRTESICADAADLMIELSVGAVSPAGATPTIRLSICEDQSDPPVWSNTTVIPAGLAARLSVRIPSPRLWWPQPLGDPFLYTLEAELLVDGVVTDRRSQRFGIRTIELKQDRRFTFCVNGVDVFARGANWVPPHSLTLDTSADQYRHLLDLAHDARFNMLRVWGGGTYEAELFYELCDERGIMVWQDFMYACAMYPDDEPDFMESAAREADEAVTRLRRHPCVVLWCGNNECQEAWELGDWYQRAPRHMGERLYDHVLPDTVRKRSPGTPYWPVAHTADRRRARAKPATSMTGTASRTGAATMRTRLASAASTDSLRAAPRHGGRDDLAAVPVGSERAAECGVEGPPRVVRVDAGDATRVWLAADAG